MDFSYNLVEVGDMGQERADTGAYLNLSKRLESRFLQLFQ